MVNHGQHAARPAVEAAPLDGTIVHYQHVLRIYSETATVDRSKSFPAPGG